MSKIKERWNNLRQKRYFKVITNKYFIATFVFLLIVLFIDNNNLIRWGSQYMKVVRQEQLIRKYRREIKNTDQKLQTLTSDKDSLEKFAREQYYFLEEGEEVFLIKKEK